MQKKIFLAIVLTSAFVSLKAQQAEPQKPEKTGDEWKMPRDVVQRSHHFADSLKKSLDLDETTTKKIFDAYMANTKPVDEINISTPDEKTRKEKLKANHEAFNEKLKSILSVGQFQKYLKSDMKRKS
ncbi:MAG: hypothetical protein JST75_11340 [Bacteroidetes bacterium]|nr:hypothetical protein [Bacteroidota bacterium]